MDFRNLTNPECGQSNPLTQMASHFTEDHTLQSKIGGLPTDGSFMPPQSFRMNDLMQEMNNLDSEGAASYPTVPSASNQDVAWTQEPLPCSSWQSPNIYWLPPTTPFYEEIPQTMRFPPPSQPERIAEGFDSEKYIVINSLDELKNVQENTEEVKGQALVEHLTKEDELLHEDIAKLIFFEFEELMKKKEQQISIENSIKHLTLLQKGLKLLAEGDLTGALLCFEDAVKEDETCVSNWLLLGTTYMKNMQVEKAFGALKQGFQLEPHNLEIIMALAENYAANQDILKTLVMLLSWLINHPKYKDVVPENFDHVNLSNENFNKALVSLFIKAAQRRPIDHDYQVQKALGLLLFINRDYHKAEDCFRSALQVKPQDPMLWNQLGITLGRMCKYEEAIDLFNHALSVDPAFLNAKFNIGLIWLNRKELREAAKHFLFILNRQSHGQTDKKIIDFIDYTSTTTWNLLYRCVSNMDRPDLREAIIRTDLKILNKEFGT